ncbi:hypothetical protein CC80DRAFT_546994 [Byssothecium circinans]|uniref:B30.2/SPRY domain-containing protein n=1 Tax=Byssothecium circinans TaxID=147558 RepID=A0A6A5U9X8_9PLEO|nr:hypothetical protein CC80DRAFT_546994 [Byssothecium circinans]
MVIHKAMHAAVAARRWRYFERLIQFGHVNPRVTSADGWDLEYTVARYHAEEVFSYFLGTSRLIWKMERSIHLPTGWWSSDLPPSLSLDQESLAVKVAGPSNPFDNKVPVSTVLTDHSMSPINKLSTCTILKSREIAVGFCEEYVERSSMIGHVDGSWAYYGSSGMVRAEGSEEQAYGEPYEKGDVIGCGFNLKSSTAFFTKNGVVIGRAFSNVKGRLFPAVSLTTASRGWHIAAKFRPVMPGQKFRFEGPYDSPDTQRPPSKGTGN